MLGSERNLKKEGRQVAILPMFAVRVNTVCGKGCCTMLQCTVLFLIPTVQAQVTLIKKEIKFPQIEGDSEESVANAKSYMTNRLLIYDIWLNICAFPHILGNPSSYMTLQPILSEFPHI